MPKIASKLLYYRCSTFIYCNDTIIASFLSYGKKISKLDFDSGFENTRILAILRASGSDTEILTSENLISDL